MKRFLSYCLFVLLLFSCKKENALDCFTTNGKEVTETRSLDAFSYIEVFDKIDVTIVQGADYKVEVTSGKNIIKNISTEVKGGVLRLDNNNKCNFVRGYKKKIYMRVTLPYLTQVTNFGVGPIVFDENFQQDNVFIRAENSGDTYINGNYDEIRTSSHGNGDIYIKGTTKRLMVYSNGTNYTRAEELKVSDYIYISTYSIGDAFFNADGVGSLDYLIWSEGNIYYTGTPKNLHDLSEVSAKGKAIQKE